MVIERIELANKLKQLKSVTPARSGEKASGVLLKNNMLIANNTELAVTATLNVNTDECFVIPMNAIELIDNLPDEKITITESKNRVTVKGMKSKSIFNTLPVEDFPIIETIDYNNAEKSFSYDGEVVTEAIKKVMYACSDKTPKPILSGILFESDGENLNIVACDGYRIAWSKVAYTGNMKVVIPKAAIQKVLSIGLDGGCNLYRFDNKRVVFQTGEYSVYARLLDGDFINYKPMFVDNKPTAKFTVNRIEFYNSVARAIICSSGTTLAKTVLESDVSETNGSLKISLAGSIAEFNEEIELEGEINEKMRIGFNARYLADCLKSSAEKVVTIAYTDEIKPLIITDDSLNQLVLPLRM